MYVCVYMILCIIILNTILLFSWEQWERGAQERWYVALQQQYNDHKKMREPVT